MNGDGGHGAEAMARITVLEFAIGDRAETKIWAHGISRDQVYEMLENRLIVVVNRRKRAAKHVVIGRDNNGRCIAVPVLPTDDPIRWRPITA